MDIATLQDFFFRAMLAGYASGAEPEPVPGMPGWKQAVPFEDEALGLRLVDRWCTHPNSDKSVGFTTIYLHDQPVWWMSYGGRYKDEAIPTLKNALKAAYESRRFCGGRGPESFRHEGLVYRNNFFGDFSSFQGGEFIFSSSNDVSLGHHQFWGMSLIDLD